MNREQLEALAVDLKGLVEARVRESNPEGFVFVGTLSSAAAKGVVVASTLKPDELEAFWFFMAMRRGEARKIDLTEGGGE